MSRKGDVERVGYSACLECCVPNIFPRKLPFFPRLICIVHFKRGLEIDSGKYKKMGEAGVKNPTMMMLIEIWQPEAAHKGSNALEIGSRGLRLAAPKPENQQQQQLRSERDAHRAAGGPKSDLAQASKMESNECA